ncbi:MspA family porin [Nocardia sp. NPDC052316]|uniref:MspA family porin n=1 Tax=Nocardia sp. NPDC052316 TaxID=3364329 RepID=UPI0037C66DC5
MRDITQHGSRCVRMFAIATVVASGLALGIGTAGAVVDSSNQIIDQKDRSIEAIQSDTRIDFVPPLDGNALTREWFHNGEAAYKIAGPNAEDWRGHITIGYQVGYPATLTGRLKFNYSTPGLGVDLGSDGATLKLEGLIPRAGVELEVGFGPGIQTVECAGGDVSGAAGFLRMSGFHGTVTGVVGQTTIRPFVKVVSSSGDAVYTYGRLWSI